ncbi:MAG: GxxExxY protein [Verrucomicrobiales bacterium]|nr:GxxExxY protein [Verrucomicrobiales bacterium]
MKDLPDNQLTGAVIGAAIDVHRELGPGVDEIAYEEAMSRRLATLGIAHRRQFPIPVIYKNVRLDCGYRIDLLVNDILPLELKAVVQVLGIHDAQLLTYLRLGKYALGLLLNFNVAVLRDGIRRRIETRGRVVAAPSSDPYEDTKRFSEVSRATVIAAAEVHRRLGPGLLASAYEECLCQELREARVRFVRQKLLPLHFDGAPLAAQARVPLVVEDQVPVFPVCADTITAVDRAAALARLRQGKWNEGLILNFNAQRMGDAIKRVIR